MNKENIRRRIRNVTAFAAALLLAAAFTFPAELGDGFFDGFGNAIVASAVTSGSCGTNLTYTYDNGTLTISGTGEMDKWIVEILVPWREACSYIKNVVIENGVTSIGNYAFCDCSNLTSITIPDSVTSIGDHAFYNCTSLTSITIPDSVTSIGEYAFYDCTSLKSIFLPNTLNVSHACNSGKATQIKYTVSGNNVTVTSVTLGSGKTSVTIPDTIGGKPVTVVYIQDGATGIKVPASATKIKYSINGDKVTIESVTLGSGQTSVTIPETIDGKNVTAVFIKDGITGVVAPASATQIKYTVDNSNNVTITGATPGEGVTSVTVPDTIDGKTVTSIRNNAFKNCSSLTSITIPDSVTSIGDHAFENCKSLTSITIPYGVTSIGEYAFYYCSSLTSITIPNSVNSIGHNAFYGCTRLTSITIPSSVNSIGNYAFYFCLNLKTIYIPASASVGKYAIPASAAQIRYTVDHEGNITITSVTLGEGQTSLTIPETIGGKAVTVVFTKDGTNISAPSSTTQIKYTVSGDNVTVTGVTLGGGQSSFTIPSTIDGKTVTAVCIKDGATGIDIPASATQIRYTVDNENVTIKKGTLGEGQTSLTIPDTIDGRTVTSIGSTAFKDCTSLTSITIPNGVTSIGDGAFRSCTNLTSLTIPDSVTSIGDGAFRSCTNLTSITIPDSVTSIGGYAFSDCRSLTSITIPDGVTSIGENAFTFCTSLTSITIPNSVNSIGHNAFYGCTRLTSITIPNGVTSIETYAIPASTTQIKYTVSGDNVTVTGVTLGSGQTSVTIPDTIDGKTVTVVFTKDGTNISAPSSATQIKYTVSGDNVTVTGVTLGSGQTSVTIPDTIGGKAVTFIESSAFESCTSLTSIFLPERLTSIGTDAIPASAAQIRYTVDNENVTITGATPGKGVTYVTIPDTIGGKTVTSIGDHAFEDCTSLTSITIPGSVTSIGEYAFHSCTSLESINIPDSVTKIDRYTFTNCTSLSVITIPKNVTSIEKSSFMGCSVLSSINVAEENTKYISDDGVLFNKNKTELLFYPANKYGTSYAIPDGVTTIESNAFYKNNNLVSITIPDGVIYIGAGAFNSCKKLTSVSIPASVNNIGTEAFISCEGLTAISVHENNSVYSSENGVLFDKNKTYLFVYPAGKSENSYTVPNTVQHIYMNSFTGCVNLENITLNEGVEKIYSNAFMGCTNLKSINIPSSVTAIGDQAFMLCTSLKTINIPSSVTAIGDLAFMGCTSLTEISVHADNSNYSSVDNVLFDKNKTTLIVYPGGKSDTSYSVPSSVTSVSSMAFLMCPNLESIAFPPSVTSFGYGVIFDCEKLASVFVPERAAFTNQIDPAKMFTSEVRYAVSDDKANITGIELGTGQTTVDIPETICGYTVASVLPSQWAKVGKHTHKWDENDNCALCGVDCSSRFDITIKEPSAGKALATQASVICNTTEENCDIIWEPAPTDGIAAYGTAYTASVTISSGSTPVVTINGEAVDSSSITANVDGTFTVKHTFVATEKRTLTASDFSFSAPSDLVYNGSAKEAAFTTAVSGAGDITVKYYDDNGTKLDSAPVNAGTYTVKIDVAEGAECAAANELTDSTWTFTIKRAAEIITGITVSKTAVVVTYGYEGTTITSRTENVAFTDVTVEMVEWMKNSNIQLVIDFVNYSTAGSDTIILTSAQMKAIEYVLEHDFGM